MKRLALLIALVHTTAFSWLTYDADRRVPFLSGGGYARDEYHWFIYNTGESSRLFQNDILVSTEYGTNDIQIAAAWTISPVGCDIGVVDTSGYHGQRVRESAAIVSQGQVLLSNSLRTYPDDIAAAISNFVSAGIKVIVVTQGTGPHSGTSNACRYAEATGALVVCSVPNAAVNIDVTHDYPSSWAGQIRSIVPITMTDRNGQLYDIAAWGTNVLGSPGRNIVAYGTYSSGTSYSAAVAAGVVSLGVSLFPGESSWFYNGVLRERSDTVGAVKRINALRYVRQVRRLSF